MIKHKYTSSKPSAKAERKPRKLDEKKEKRWRGLFALFSESRLSFREFCAREGISPNTFQYWRKELRKRDEVRGVTSTIKKGCNLSPDLQQKKIQHWMRIIDEINAYGGSINSYCRNNGVSSGSLHFWENRLMKMKLTKGVRRQAEQTAPTFVPVQISDTKLPASDGRSEKSAELDQRIEIKLRNAVVMSLPLTTSVDILICLVNGLAQ